MGIRYATREQIKAAAKIAGADFNDTIDRLNEDASRAVERLTRRKFYPTIATKYYDYPAKDSRPFDLWLNDDLLALTTLTSGGTTIANKFLEPNNYGPPYNRIRVEIAEGESFESGDSSQRQIVVTGRWGYSEDTAVAGTITEDLTTSETDVDVSDSGKIGVGDLILVGSERMLVTEKSLLDTGLNLNANLTTSDAETTIAFDGSGTLVAGEVITIDSERMFIESISGSNLTVKRAYDGTALATHSDGADIYAPRTLTVVRAAAGTTAASHLTAAAITRNLPPGPITSLVIAEVEATFAQEDAKYGRNIGQGEGASEMRMVGLAQKRKQVEEDYRRRRAGGAI